MRDHPVQRHEVGDPAVVDLLESLLDRARAGELTSVAVVAATTDRGVATCWTLGEAGNLFILMGGLSELKHRLLTEACEQHLHDTDEE